MQVISTGRRHSAALLWRSAQRVGQTSGGEISQSTSFSSEAVASSDAGLDDQLGRARSGRPSPASAPPALQRFARDLTEEARRGLLDPLLGRQQVLMRLVQVLMRRTKNNPLLLGDAGVGKTALVEGLAQLLASQHAPPGLRGKRLLSVDVGGLVAGSSFRGEFEARLQALIVEATSPDVVLFIDEIHMLVGAGRSEGGLDAVNMLKGPLARGALRLIGATTLDEYRTHLEKDPALTRRLQPVRVEEPDEAEALLWLRGVSGHYASHHGVTFTEGALRAAVRCAKRYVPDRRLPDSAIDLMDEAAARAALTAASQGLAASQLFAPSRSLPHTHLGARRERSAGEGPATLTHRSPSLTHGSLSPLDQHTSIVSRDEMVGCGGSRASAAGGCSQAGSCGYGDVCSHAQPSRMGDQETHLPALSSMSSSGTVSSANSHGHDELPEHVGQMPPFVSSKAPYSSSAVTDWRTWVSRQHWQGQQEVHRQKLLEWFGSTPAEPLPGYEGHRQTTSERRRKHSQLFGATANAAAGSTSSSSSSSNLRQSGSALPGPMRPVDHALGSSRSSSNGSSRSSTSGSSTSSSSCASKSCSSSSCEKKPQDMLGNADPGTGMGMVAGAGGLPGLRSKGLCRDDLPKACPHCGTLVEPFEADSVRLTCPSCTARFLNISPDKLMLGTTIASPMPLHAQAYAHAYAWGMATSNTLQQTVTHGSVSGSGPSYGSSAATAMRTLRTDAVQSSSLPQVPQKPASAGLQAGGLQAGQDSARGLNTVAASAANSALATRQLQPQQGSVQHASGMPFTMGQSATSSPGLPLVDERMILSVVSDATGIPAHALSPSHTPAALAALEARLRKHVIGVDSAVQAVMAAVRLWRLGLTGGAGRPAASFVFTGLTGTGKSTLCSAIGDELFGGQVLTLNGSDYSERASVSRLIGAPPGYVGYGQGALLVDALRRNAHCLLVVREPGRMHPEVVELLARALKDGEVSDSRGTTATLRHTFVVFTQDAIPQVRGQAGPMGQRAEQQQQHGSGSRSSSHDSTGGGGMPSGDTAGSATNFESASGAAANATAMGAPATASAAVHDDRLSVLWEAVDRVVEFEPLTHAQGVHVVQLKLSQLSQQLAPLGVTALAATEAACSRLLAVAQSVNTATVRSEGKIVGVGATFAAISTAVDPTEGQRLHGGLHRLPAILRMQVLEPLTSVLLDRHAAAVHAGTQTGQYLAGVSEHGEEMCDGEVGQVHSHFAPCTTLVDYITQIPVTSSETGTAGGVGGPVLAHSEHAEGFFEFQLHA